MNIDSIITDRLAQTEALFTESDLDWSGAKSRAVTLAKLEVYGTDKAESGIPDDRIKEFIALKACLPLIDLAIDYFMDAKRLADTKQESTISYYDRVEILTEKRERIEREIASKAGAVLDLVDTDSIEDAVIDVSTLHPDKMAASKMLTPSPWALRPK